MFHKNRMVFKICFVLILAAIAVSPVFAQQDEYRLGLNKIVGFSSGDQIRGSMNLYVIGPAENIQSVKYTIDGKVVTEVTQPPFTASFQTASFDFGYHDLSAVVQTKDGRTVETAIRKFKFATAQEESSNVLNFLGPLLGLVVLVLGLGFVSQMILFRNKIKTLPPGTQREYGFRGGTICPNCKRPYAFHWWSPNLLTSKFDRCDFCGKFALARHYSIEELRKAEQNEIQSFDVSETIVQKSEEEKLREMLERSKYSDH
ncbi:MAG TPA: hypothetical protein VMS73_00600 [Anaerolineaceae bacterium]|nr:hypothetical protein [Anaerolineaceae bacterium]